MHEHGSAPRPRTATPDDTASRPHHRTAVTGDARTIGGYGRP
ncbi:hypothetical protein [Streptomyces diastatochromogenes]